MLIISNITCGHCDQPLENLDEDEHYCEDRAWYDAYEENWQQHVPFRYSATALMEAQAFLDTHPEFKEFQDLNAHRKVAAYETADQRDYAVPSNYETTTGFPLIQDALGSEVTREDEWDATYANRDQYQREVINRWRDVEPTRCTTAIYQWSNLPNTPGFPERITIQNLPRGFSIDETYAQLYVSLDFQSKQGEDDRTLVSRMEFSELQGFASELLIDAGITEKFQFKVFNVFFGRDSKLHCGLLTITDTVTCGKRDCHYHKHPLNLPTDPDRRTMEAFTHAIIRHGNNHGPDWLLARKDFTYIHAENCNAHNHTDLGQFCNADGNGRYFDTSTLEGALEFTIQHRKFCRDTRCRCGAYYHALCDYYQQTQLVLA